MRATWTSCVKTPSVPNCPGSTAGGRAGQETDPRRYNQRQRFEEGSHGNQQEGFSPNDVAVASRGGQTVGLAQGSTGQGRERRREGRPIRAGSREEPHKKHPGARSEPRSASASKARLPLRGGQRVRVTRLLGPAAAATRRFPRATGRGRPPTSRARKANPKPRDGARAEKGVPGRSYQDSRGRTTRGVVQVPQYIRNPGDLDRAPLRVGIIRRRAAACSIHSPM
jgi:hypothetical protein